MIIYIENSKENIKATGITRTNKYIWQSFKIQDQYLKINSITNNAPSEKEIKQYHLQ